MSYREKLIQATTVLLYMGPLLAGLAGFGPAYLFPFVSLFMLWLVMLRPHKWPQNITGWFQPAALLAAVTLLVSQTLFVALLFGAGRGLGGVLGYLPLFHPFLPVALSFLAVPLLRLVWVPEQALAEGKTIDQLLWSDAAPMRPLPVSAEGAVSDLFALSEDGRAGAEILLDRLDHFLDTGDSWSRLAALSAALDAVPASTHVSLRTAVILKATDPCPQPEFTIPGEMRAAFAAAGNAVDLLSLLALRGRALLQKMPGAASCFPPRELVLDLAEACEDGVTARALRDLAGSLQPALPENPARADQPRVDVSAARSGKRGFVTPASAQGA